ncbi:MAG TPA: hypothetical protein VIN09_02320 [Chloroflexota bacterium]
MRRLLVLLLFPCLIALACQDARPEPTAPPSDGASPTAGAAEPRPARPTPALGKLAFVRGGDIWVKELPDGEARQVTRDGRSHTPRWSPSGSWLAFRREEQLWIVRGSGADARQIAADASGPFAWAPAADHLAYVDDGGLFVVDAERTDPRELVPRSGRDGSGVFSMAWSPDGTWIAYGRQDVADEIPGQPPRVTAGLWRVHVERAERQELFRGATSPDPSRPQAYSPGAIVADWSKDGQRILFWADPFLASLLADGTQLMAIPANGGTPREIVTSMLANRDFLSWSPDGRSLALVQGAGRMTWSDKSIVVTSPTAEGTRLSDGGRADLFPAWSPDGEWIAFTSGPALAPNAPEDAVRRALDERRIWLARPDGSEKHPLAGDSAARDERPLWSSDGDYVLFVRRTGERAQLWLVRSDGTGPRPVVEELSPEPDWFGYYGYTDWAQYFDWWQRPTTG